MEQEIEQFQAIYTQITAYLVNYSFQIVGAIIVVLLGLLVARKVGLFVEQQMVSHKIDVTLSRFSGSGVKVVILAMFVIIALGKLGISVTPFVAAIGALSLGAGLALQGMLSNYSAGVVIVVTRPFIVGDTIAVQGVSGLVKEVRLGTTALTTEDGVQITIPNKFIVGEIIHNSFTNSIVEMTLDISYGADPLRAVDLVKASIESQSGVSVQQPPQVGIQDFGANGYTLGIRYWVSTELLFQTRFLANAAIHRALKQNGLMIALPQREVKVLSQVGIGTPPA
jgi:small conductance mechanosensitive channel